MIKLFETTALLLLVACGQVGPETNNDEGCEPYYESYSHTLLSCEDYEDAFRVCNSRQHLSERDPNCVTCDLMEFEEGCDLTHICFTNLAYWEENDGE